MAGQVFLAHEQIDGENDADNGSKSGGHGGGDQGHERAHHAAQSGQEKVYRLCGQLLPVDGPVSGKEAGQRGQLIGAQVVQLDAQLTEQRGQLLKEQGEALNQLGQDHADDQDHQGDQAGVGQKQTHRAAALEHKAVLRLGEVPPLVHAHQDVDGVGDDRAQQQGEARPQGRQGQGGQAAPVVDGQIEPKQDRAKAQRGLPFLLHYRPSIMLTRI